MIRAALALALANARYWPTVAPVVRRELERWRGRAQAIPDPELRALALSKLSGERFNAEVAATLATLAPRAHRRDAVEAIVALEVLFDHLDGRTEQPLRGPSRRGRAAVRARSPTPCAPSPPTTACRRSYLQELSAPHERRPRAPPVSLAR